jgi:3-oxoacyl-[acyl-carrier protein] reductase
MDLNLSNKIVMITGASSGIGAAAANLFAVEGADIIIAYGRNLVGAENTQQLVGQHGRKSWICQLDLEKADSIHQAIQDLLLQVDHIDILVLCAGHNRVTPIGKIEPAEWEKIVNINLNGVFYVLQAVRPVMQPGGAIVTVSSVAAHTGAPHHAHYAAAKAGLINLTKSAARSFAPDIRVNCVAPGITLTPMGQATVASLEPDYAKNKLLLQRFATPDEIARCIVFLASPAASFITGATLDVNGGRELR